MWGDVLKKINHSHAAQKAIKAWNGKKHSLKLISEGINLVYYFKDNDRGNYLRITHPELRSKAELAAAIEYQEHLFLSAAPVCEPVKSLNDCYIELITQEREDFLAHVNAEVKGKIMNFDEEKASLYQTWGQALATLHQAAKLFSPSSPNGFKHWQDVWAETKSYLHAEDEAIQKEFNLVNDWLNTQTKTKDNFGLVHHDHRTGNVLYDGTQVHIIDFDEPIYHWYAMDVVRPFLEVSRLKQNNIANKWLWYIDGYSKIAVLSDEDLKRMPWLLRMKIIEIYLWVKNNWHEEQIAPGGVPTKVQLLALRELIINPTEVVF